MVLFAVAGLFQGCDSLWGGRPTADRPLQVKQTIGEVGSSPGQFLFPRAMSADTRGWGDESDPHLWVIDKAGRIQRLNAGTGRAALAFRAPEIALGRPCGVSAGPPWRNGPFSSDPSVTGPDLLYVADTHYHRILIYAPPDSASEAADAGRQPRLVAQFGRYGRGPGEFIYVTDVAILTDESGYAVRFYVGEYGGNDRISIWEPQEDGTIAFVRAFGEPGFADPEADGDEPIVFDRPQSLEIDQRRGRLVVTDAGNHRIGVFTLDGDLVRWIDGREDPHLTAAGTPEAEVMPEGGFRTLEVGGGMAYPFGLLLLDDGSALVTESGQHRVRHVDLEDGRVLGMYGIGGRGPGQLLNPWAVTMVGRTVYVLDSGNDRIQAFDLPGGGRALAGGGGVMR